MFHNSILNIVCSSAAVYVFITIAIRIFGKKELAQLSVMDLVFVLLISNAVQNAMVGSDSTLLGGLVAALTLFLIDYLFKYLQYRSKKFTHLMEGEAIVVVYNGRVNDKNMRKVRLTTDELLEAIREHGVSSIKDVNLALLEVDGNISILSNNYQKRSTRHISRGKKQLQKKSF